jgi:phospholipid/cholesterol/gamma-HCH transport system substrate-binding protein
MAHSTERKVGLFFVLSLILLGVMLEVGEKWNPFDKKIPYKTYLTTVTGLKIGDPVRLAGVNVGKINTISVLDSNVEIDFEVTPGTKIKTDTVASLRLTNLLGGQFLSLSFGSPSAPLLEAGGTVTGKDSANIDVIVDTVSDAVKDARVLIKNLNKNQDEVMKKISNILDDNRANLADSIANFKSITAKIDSGEGSLAMLLNDKKLYSTLSSAGENINSLTAKIDKGEGTLGKLVNDPSLYNDLKIVIGDVKGGAVNMNAGFKEIREIAEKINRGEGTLGKFVKDEAVYADLKETSKNLNEITRKINSGEGTLGKLINEDKLYRDTTATMKKVEKAAEGIGDTGPISVLGSIVGTLF